jgi:zinc protease
MKILRLLLVFSLLLPFVPPAPAAEPRLPQGITRFTSVEGVTEYRMDNGLKLLFVPDPSTDTVTVNVTYMVGSRHEGYGESGMAHLLEHLVFRGSPKYPDIKAELQKRGARYNGSTSNDRTNYYETLSSTDANLEFAIALEADRMINANISKAELDAEMTIVRNEFESGENSYANVLRQRVVAAAFDWHGYGRSTIGARSDIENVPLDRLRAFYRLYYQPDNAVAIIAGKFDEAKALALARKHFGAIPKPKRTLPATYTVEPTQEGERQVTLRRAGDLQGVTALYHLPPGTHPDYAAVDLLIQILGHTPSGRLHKALIESGKAATAFGQERQLREAGYAYFGAGVRMDQPLDAAREALLATVEGLEKAPVTAEEVENARTRLLNDIEMTVADSRGLAMVLSEVVAMGDWRFFYLHRDRLRKVTAEEVQRVARQYLKSSNRTVGIFIPTSAPDRAVIPAVPDLQAALKDYKGQTVVSQGEAFDPTPANIEKRVQRRNLPGGMKLAMLPRRTRGNTVVADLAIHWGDEDSKTGRSSACSITSSMLQRGTKTRTRQQISNEFARLRATVGVSGSGASIETVRENLPEVMRLVAEILREPSFPEAEFTQLRQSGLASIESQRSDPSALSGLALRRHIDPYPPEHWSYNATLEERLQRLKAVTLEDVRACHRDFFGASNSELAVVGDFDPEQVAKLAQELFGDWKSPKPYRRIPARLTEVRPIDETIRTPDKANATYRAAAALKLRDDDPDFPALVLGNYMFGGSSNARLVQRVREKEGLSYSVSSYLSAGSLDERGEFGIQAIYAPQNRERVDAAVADELRRLVTEGYTPEEVETGKKAWLQARQVARSRDSAIAGRLGVYLEIGRTFGWDAEIEKRVASLTAAEVNAALRRRLGDAKLSVVKAGDFRTANTGG